MAGCGEQPGCSRRPNMDKESDQQGPESSDDRSAADPKENPECSLEKKQVRKKTLFTEEQLDTLEALFQNQQYLSPTECEQLANHLSLPERNVKTWFQNRRTKVKNQKKFDQQGPESSDDHSAAPHEENPEYLLKKIQVCKKTVKAQLDTLEAFFKKEQYLTPTELEQLANHLSLPQQSIQSWFQNQRAKVRREALTFKPEFKFSPHTGSKALTQDQWHFLHKQKMEATINCVQTQKWFFLDSFPPPRPMDSFVLPQGLHSSGLVYCQNVGGPPDSRFGTEICKMPPESSHKPPSDPHFNLPGTSIWIPISSLATDLTSDDGPSTSSAPSTPQMPIAWENADEGSSTDPASLTDVEATDSV